MSATLGRPTTRPNTPENRAVRQRDLNRYYDIDVMVGWAKNAMMNARRRAKKKATQCTLTLSDLLEAAELVSHCRITGEPLRYGRGNGKPSRNSASVDRVNNDLPYEAGNIAIISAWANIIKSNCTLDQMVKIGDYAKGLI